MNCKIIRRNLLDIEDLSLDFSNLSEYLQSHIKICSPCSKYYRELCQIQQELGELSKTHPPKKIIENYQTDLKRKLKQEDLTFIKNKLPGFGIIRPVFATIMIILISVSGWWFGIRSEPEADLDNLTTESLEYYIDSFNQESSQNPITTVRGLEYEWAYYRISANGK